MSGSPHSLHSSNPSPIPGTLGSLRVTRRTERARGEEGDSKQQRMEMEVRGRHTRTQESDSSNHEDDGTFARVRGSPTTERGHGGDSGDSGSEWDEVLHEDKAGRLEGEQEGAGMASAEREGERHEPEEESQPANPSHQDIAADSDEGRRQNTPSSTPRLPPTASQPELSITAASGPKQPTIKEIPDLEAAIETKEKEADLKLREANARLRIADLLVQEADAKSRLADLTRKLEVKESESLKLDQSSQFGEQPERRAESMRILGSAESLFAKMEMMDDRLEKLMRYCDVKMQQVDRKMEQADGKMREVDEKLRRMNDGNGGWY